MWELWRKCRLKCQVVCGQYGQGRANAICTVMHRSQWANSILHASRAPSRTEISKWSKWSMEAHTHVACKKKDILIYHYNAIKECAQKDTTSEITDEVEININHLRFIPHSLSLYGKEQAVDSSKCLLLCPIEVIHV